MKTHILAFVVVFFSLNCTSQQPRKLSAAMQKFGSEVPAVYSGIMPDNNGELYFVSVKTGDTSWMSDKEPFYTLDNIRIEPKGTENGLFFDFNNNQFFGTLYYGLFAKNDAQYPQPVYFRMSSKIIEGKAEIDISILKEKYDIAGWEKSGKAKVGYRITDNYGNIIYNGNINIKGVGPFEVDMSIIAGPYVNRLSDEDVVIWFETNRPCSPIVVVDGKQTADSITNSEAGIRHEIKIDNLHPDTKYDYTVHYGDNELSYSFKTAPKPGSRTPFTFAYTSDSRAGSGGGERDIYGVNGYVMKKMAVLAAFHGSAFFQFTGDMINGYSSSIGETNLEYANWKKAVEPVWHYLPFNIGAGNHEALVNAFDDGSQYSISVDKFPFSTKSAETTFSNNFVNSKNGPQSEDGEYYDPNKSKPDFPEYGETVYYYTYDNVAVIVLNSNYWYAPSTNMIPEIGGNPHGYIMDNQLKWFEEKIIELNNNLNIDHIFVTIHTPAFPNGGHANNDMWYFGNNNIRPTVAGAPVKKGIIERRDEFLNIMINKSEKVVALLCGDEHNYSRMRLTKKTPIYPEGYKGKELKVSRPFWQITNGSAGAPYYGQEQLPWSESVEKFSTQYALMLLDVDGKKVSLRVINPDTLEEIETVDLK
ncbi:MAG: metallophosphoesterase family protein [Bacteroidetes bacterium]|nr:metallophosphoesterase family protein [Bacteroidota bacterium]MBL6942837.1 metallophosphoesterase family protein [Bacteroidales bacterium]